MFPILQFGEKHLKADKTKPIPVEAREVTDGVLNGDHGMRGCSVITADRSNITSIDRKFDRQAMSIREIVTGLG